MKIYNVTYNLISKHKSNYIILSDFHGYFNLKLAKYISNIKANYIIIAGDLLNGYQWINKRKLLQVKNFLNIISIDHKVIIGLGNHDLWGLTNEGFTNFKNLKSKNIYPIYNETIILDNDLFTNFIPDKSCYSYPKQDKIKVINNIIKQYKNIKLPDRKYTCHLISHNPYHFIHNKVIEIISKNYDFIETGHFHDGWIPTKFLHKSYNICLDKGLHEVIRNIFFKTNIYKLTVKPKRILSRGTIYMYKDKYYILLPDNQIYKYDKINNKYSKIDDIRNKLKNNPAIIVSGAINTYMKLKIFYPHITYVNTNNDIISSKSNINVI